MGRGVREGAAPLAKGFQGIFGGVCSYRLWHYVTDSVTVTFMYVLKVAWTYQLVI